MPWKRVKWNITTILYNEIGSIASDVDVKILFAYHKSRSEAVLTALRSTYHPIAEQLLNNSKGLRDSEALEDTGLWLSDFTSRDGSAVRVTVFARKNRWLGP